MRAWSRHSYSRSRSLASLACAGLTVVAAAGMATQSAAPSAAQPTSARQADAAGGGTRAQAVTPGGHAVPVQLAADPLGVNVAPWDSQYAAKGSVNLIQSRLRGAGIDILHFGGGSFADFYDWQTDTDIYRCLPDRPNASFTGPCAQGDPLEFGQFSRQARAIGAASFVTVNYGSGTPRLAAQWAALARTVPGENVTLWEVGNEAYGCWEVDNELAEPPEHYPGYKPDYYVTAADGTRQNPTCPWNTQGSAKGTQTLASSYAANALSFLKAIKKANPAAKVGIPWAFDHQVAGAGVPYAGEWNDTVLRAAGKSADFVDARYYPFGFHGATGGANPADQQVLRALLKIPSLEAGIRSRLDAYNPKAGVVVGETGISNAKTTAVCEPVGALFAAGDALAWLAAGAESIQWWDLNDDGNSTSRCADPDSGFFTSSASPAPETPYVGYLLAAKLARPGARLAVIPDSDPADVLAYESVLPDGKRAVALINTNTSAAKKVTLAASSGLTGTLQTFSYSAGDQNAASTRIVTGTRPAKAVGNGVTLPRESMVVLETK